jgi:hypothetical protein
MRRVAVRNGPSDTNFFGLGFFCEPTLQLHMKVVAAKARPLHCAPIDNLMWSDEPLE